MSGARTWWRRHSRIAQIHQGRRMDRTGRMIVLRLPIRRPSTRARARPPPAQRRRSRSSGMECRSAGPPHRSHRACMCTPHNLATALMGERDYGHLRSACARDRCPLHNWQSHRREDGPPLHAQRDLAAADERLRCTTGGIGAREAACAPRGLLDAIVNQPPENGPQLGDDLSGRAPCSHSLCETPIRRRGAGGARLRKQPARRPCCHSANAVAPNSWMRAQDPGFERERLLALIAELAQTSLQSARCAGIGADDRAEMRRVRCACPARPPIPCSGRFSDRWRLQAEAAHRNSRDLRRERLACALAVARDIRTGRRVVNRFKRYFLDEGNKRPSPGNIARDHYAGGKIARRGATRATPTGRCDRLWRHRIAATPDASRAPGTCERTLRPRWLRQGARAVAVHHRSKGHDVGFLGADDEDCVERGHRLHRQAGLDRLRRAGRSVAWAAKAPMRSMPPLAPASLATASGRPTAAETGGQRVIAIWKRGVTL